MSAGVLAGRRPPLFAHRARTALIERGPIPAPAASLLLRYAVAIGLAVASVGMTRLVEGLRVDTPYLLSFAAVMLASWLGGLGPGLLTVAVCLLGIDYFVREPLHEISMAEGSQAVSAVIFVIITALVSWLNAARLRADAEQDRLLHQEQAARREAIEGRNRMSFLADVSATLATSLDFETTLQQVAQLVVPDLADWCAVHVVEENGRVGQLVVAHADPAKVSWVRRIQERYPPNPDAATGVYQVVRTGAPELYPVIPDEMLVHAAVDAEHLAAIREVGMTSAMVVPMTSRGRVLGALTFVSSNPARRYDEDDLRLADIVARRCAQAIDNARLFREAQTAETRYRSLFEGTAEAVFVIAPDGRYLDANDAASDLLGYSRDEFRRMRIGEVTGRGPDWAERERVRFFHDGDWRGEVELRRKDGSMVPCEGRAREIQIAAGPVFVVTWRDASERRELERMQQEFLASVSHDLKNPLAAARATTQLTRRRLRRGGVPPAEELERSLVAIEDALGRTGGLLDELSDVARTRLGQPLELAPAPVDLVALVRCAAEDHARATDRHRISVDTTVPELIGAWDPGRLARVVDNLLANAIKYSPNGGDIRVEIGVEERSGGCWACVAVSDHGVGIPADDLPQLFTRFHRGANVLGRFRGTGMGLAGSRQIVEQHGGTITAESVEGRGSTFTVRLPLPPGDQPRS